MYLLVQMLLFRKKRINFLVYFLVIFSVFSQNSNDEFDFLDKIDNLKKKEPLKVEEKKTIQIKKNESIQVKKKTKRKKQKVVKKSKKKTIEESSFWIDEKLNFNPYFEQFGFQVISKNKNIVQNKKDVYQKKEPISDGSETSVKMTITDLLKIKGTEFKENFAFKDIIDIMIEYKKAIMIFISIILFTFLRNKYIMKSSKSMMLGKKTIISNKSLNKRKY